MCKCRDGSPELGFRKDHASRRETVENEIGSHSNRRWWRQQFLTNHFLERYLQVYDKPTGLHGRESVMAKHRAILRFLLLVRHAGPVSSSSPSATDQADKAYGTHSAPLTLSLP